MHKTPVPYETLKQTILNYHHPNNNKYIEDRTKAAMAFQYVLSCRVGELVTYLHPAHTNKKGITRPAFETVGLLKSQVKEYPDHWEITIPNFKHEKGKTTKHYKTGIISKINDEQWLRNICFNWLAKIKGDIVFPIKPITLRLDIANALHTLGVELRSESIEPRKVASHHLRDSRADHLYKIAHMDLLGIKETLGHKNLATTNEYLGGNTTERIKKINEAKMSESNN